MTYKERMEQARLLQTKAAEIMHNPESTAEEKNQVPKMIADAKQLLEEAGRMQEVQQLGAEMAEKQAALERENKAAPPVQPSEFKGWQEFLYAAWRATHRNPMIQRVDPRLRVLLEAEEGPDLVKQMSEAVGAAGGFLVPPEFLMQLQAAQAEGSIARPRASIIRMRRRQINIPVLDQTGTTAGLPHWFGGMRAYWAAEASAKTLTDPEFRQVTLTAHKLIMYTYGSDELLDDSAISISDFLSGPLGFAGCIAWNEDYTFINGTGAGQPLGYIVAGATITVARVATAPSFQYQDAINMLQNFLPGASGLWVMSQSQLSNAIQMNGPAGNPSYVWQPNAREGVPGYLFGFPVIWTEKTPLAGTTGDVGLVDWRYYLIGDRQATTVETTQYDRWRYDQTSWRAVHRVDGQPWLSAPLTLQDGTSQVSPFVILGAKST